MSSHIFVTAINCMDGRVQQPVISWLKQKYQATYVDMITEPGPIKILAEQQPSTLVDSIKKRVEISVHKHGSKLIAVIGHYDCAGNPVEKEIQCIQLQKTIQILQDWELDVTLIKLWVDENWMVHKVK